MDMGSQSSHLVGSRGISPEKAVAEKQRPSGHPRVPTTMDSFLWGLTWGIGAHRVWGRCFLALRAHGRDVGEVHPGVTASLLQNFIQWLIH